MNLALNITDEERERSFGLDTAVEEDGELWEVIVRYDEGLQTTSEETRESLWEILSRANVLGTEQDERRRGVRVSELLGGYGILTLTKTQLLALSQVPQITYIEMPKRLFFSVVRGREASCISPIQTGIFGRENLFGRGVLVAVIDSGERVIIMLGRKI